MSADRNFEFAQPVNGEKNLFVAKISKFCIIDMEIYPNFVRKIREASYADQEDMVRGKQNICSAR